ncbi:hypothetical protein [Bacillus sp. MRMR6]|uniref:hypothetical protein n=1 Tax=Bacillus sp. MRMR6 TaxID=1928617 RepID=UPI0009526BB6|nr:hypothetical protein [Bacillus sp. MRMR6]OLS39157.1 hypothetical protein BTR25_13585 [Bacillus sp. MRMR6]
MGIERVVLCLNTEDPEQRNLYEFVTKLPSGKKRNASGFLKTLVDREYQKQKAEYLAEKAKKTPEAPRVEVIKANNGGIRYIKKD